MESLLDSHQNPGRFLGCPPSDEYHDVEPAIPAPGSVIGPYKLLQQIGEGGMGVVYMAEQTEPVERRVALKIIKPGMDTRNVIARFEAERQALAMMDHPNIATVLDAGMTDTGRPYFVMELVKGVPVTQYCDQRRLTPRERLDLFIPVCRAVQHAHQKGIIHRDIKPSNVLIAEYDNQPVPKIIDFGVAKAVEQRLTQKTMFTEFGQVVGTFEYMSPEQAKLNQLDIDTRTDVYSLGVLLYELLTGETPFDQQRLRNTAFDELLRIIREEDPPRPSLRLSSSASLPLIAANRQVDSKKLSMLVRGELDWIVMKAMEKDRLRRYETASSFAEDVHRFLNDEAIIACPPTASYRFHKFAKRNKLAIASAAIIIASLTVGVTIATWQAVRARRSETAARQSEDLANQRFIAERTARSEARKAENLATRRLFDSYVAQAQASRWSGRPGQRLRALEAVQQAAGLLDQLDLSKESRLVLQKEAIAAITSIDLRPQSTWKICNDTEGRLALSPDFNWFAVDDRFVETPQVRVRRFGDVDTDVLNIPLRQSRASITMFSSDGQHISVEYDRRRASRVWKIATNTQLLDVPGTAIDFSSDGKLFASGEPDGTFHIYDLQLGERIHSHRLGGGAIECGRFSPDGRRLALSRSQSDVVEVRDTATGALIDRTTSNTRLISTLAWHPDGHRLAVACWQKINIWDVPDGDSEPFVIRGHESQINNIQFHSVGQFIATDSWDGTSCLWSTATGDRLLRLQGDFVRFDQSGQRFALRRGLDLNILDFVPPKACHWLCNGRIYDVAVGGNGRLLAMSTGRGVRLWDLATNTQIATLPIGYTHGVQFDATGKSLFTSGNVGVQVWPVECDLTSNSAQIGPPEPLDPQLRNTSSFGISADGRTWIAERGTSASWTGRATLVVNQDQNVETYDLVKPYLTAVTASPNGQWVAAGNKWGEGVTVWRAADGKQVRQLTARGSAIQAFSPDSQWIVTNGGDAVRFWEVGTWNLRHTFPAASTAGSSIAFTDDSQMAAIARSGQGISLVDVRSGDTITVLETNARRPRIESICFTPDGQKVIAATGERGVCVWDLNAIGRELESMNLAWDLPMTKRVPTDDVNVPLRINVELGPFSEEAKTDS